MASDTVHFSPYFSPMSPNPMIFRGWHDPEIGWGPQPQEHLPGTILEGLRADPESWETSVKNGAGATQRGEWWGATPHLTLDGGLDAGWLGWLFLNEFCRGGSTNLVVWVRDWLLTRFILNDSPLEWTMIVVVKVWSRVFSYYILFLDILGRFWRCPHFWICLVIVNQPWPAYRSLIGTSQEVF